MLLLSPRVHRARLIAAAVEIVSRANYCCQTHSSPTVPVEAKKSRIQIAYMAGDLASWSSAVCFMQCDEGVSWQLCGIICRMRLFSSS